MRRSLFVACVLLALSLTPARAEACSCIMWLSGYQACEERWTHAAVFVGRVTAVEPTTKTIAQGVMRSQNLVTFKVSEAFVGPAGTVRVVTGLGDADCGFKFEPGREYLVYAYRESDGRLGTGICTATRAIEKAAEHLAYLRAVPGVPGRAGRLMGRVIQAEPEHSLNLREAPPYGGARIIAAGPGVTRSTTSTPEGTFEILVPPGRYRLRAEVPEGMYATVWKEEVELKDARACATSDVTVHYDGHIRARIVGPSGDPVPFLPLEVMSHDPQRQRELRGRTAADGTVDIGHVPAGRYTLRTPFAPAALAPVEAVLTPSARVTIGDVPVIDGTTFVTMRGVVRDASGKPATGARVSISAMRDPKVDSPLRWAEIVTEPDGSFAIAVVEGMNYKVDARLWLPSRQWATDERPSVAASRDLAPLSLTVVVR